MVSPLLAKSAPAGREIVNVTPERAGWTHVGFRAVRLNPAESEDIIQLILNIREKGLTQMVIEHDMKAIMRISDRIVVINSGKKLMEGSPDEVVSNPAVIEAYLGPEN